MGVALSINIKECYPSKSTKCLTIQNSSDEDGSSYEAEVRSSQCFRLFISQSGYKQANSVPKKPASVAQLAVPSDWRPGGRGFNPCRGQQHSFVEIDHEILSTVILSLPLIQEGQLLVSGERMCTILVNHLED